MELDEELDKPDVRLVGTSVSEAINRLDAHLSRVNKRLGRQSQKTSEYIRGQQCLKDELEKHRIKYVPLLELIVEKRNWRRRLKDAVIFAAAISIVLSTVGFMSTALWFYFKKMVME